MAELGRADDWGGHARLVQQPGERHLRPRDAALAGHLREAVDDVEVLSTAVPLVLERIRFGAPRLALALSRARAGKKAAREGAPRDNADALVDALRDHLALFLAVEQVVVVLHRDEWRPAVALGDSLGLRELPRVHAARADVARLPGLHDVVQRLHRLLDRRKRIPAVDLVEVDGVHLQPPERRVDRVEDVLAGEAASVRAGRHREVDLRGDDGLFARKQLPQQPAGHDLAGAVRVHVGRVEEREPALDGAPDDRLRRRLVEHPGPGRVLAVAHHPEAEPRDVQPRVAEPDLIHQAAWRWSATPAMTSAIPARSTAVGNWRRTTTPTAVAVAGNSATNSAYVARGRRAIAS